MTTRAIRPREDLLFVEGPDDGVFVNALVKRHLEVDLADLRLVKTNPDGGGADWALGKFDEALRSPRRDARVGLIIDRDREENDKLPAVRARFDAVRHAVDSGAVTPGQFDIWMWPNNKDLGDLETLIAAMAPPPPDLLTHADRASREARSTHGAEFRAQDELKATLKVRSIWLDARRAGGYQK